MILVKIHNLFFIFEKCFQSRQKCAVQKNVYILPGPYFREKERGGGHGAPTLKRRSWNESGALKFGPKFKVAPQKIEASAPKFALKNC